MSESNYKDLSQQTEQKVASAIKKTAAVTSGAYRGVASVVSESSQWGTWPKWAKILFVIAAIWVVLAVFF